MPPAEPSAATDSRIQAGARAQVVVVGRHRRLALLASEALSRAGFILRFAADEAAAREALFASPPDAVLILRDGDGAEALQRCKTLRATGDPAILVLGEDASVDERVAGLGCADDYVTLPVAPAELAARVASVLRRTAPCREGDRPRFDDGTLSVDLRRRMVTLGGGPVDLTPTEYRVLALLVGSPGRTFTHEQILQRVWGWAVGGDSHLLRLQIANLRAKIDRVGAPSYIETHRGVGYAFRGPRPRSA